MNAFTWTCDDCEADTVEGHRTCSANGGWPIKTEPSWEYCRCYTKNHPVLSTSFHGVPVDVPVSWP